MPIPAIVAGGIMAAGAIGNYLNQKEKNENTKAMYDDIADYAAQVEAKNAGDIGRYQSFIQRQYGSDAAKYSPALEAFLNSPTYQQGNFEYTGSVEDYLDPAREQTANAAMAALDREAANKGSVMSSDYYNQMAAKQRALASDEWSKAYDRLTQARQQQLAAYNANSQAGWNNYNADVAKQQFGINQYGTAQQNLVGGYGDALSAGIQNRTAALQSQANVAGAALNAANQQQSILGQLAGPAAQFLGSYYGGGS